MNNQCTGCKGFIFLEKVCVATCDSCAFRKNRQIIRCQTCIKTPNRSRCNYRWDGVTEK